MDKLNSRISAISKGYLEKSQGLKDGKKSGKVNKEEVPSQDRNQLGQTWRATFCSYCNKAFSDSRYLIKHVLRRHSDELLQMHTQFMNESCRQRNPRVSTLSKVLPGSIEKDIIDIKQSLNELKSQIVMRLQLHNVGDVSLQEIEGSARKMNKALKSESAEVKKLHVELQELKLQCQNCETVIHNLEERHRLAFDAVKCEIVSNEEMKEQNDAKIKRMMRNGLRVQKKELAHVQEEIGKQLVTFQQIIISDLQKQCQEWDNRLLNVSSKCALDIKELKSVMQTNITKLEKIQSEKNVEEMFEHRLQNYLKKISENPKKKHMHAVDVSQPSLNLKGMVSSRLLDDPAPSHSRHITSKVPKTSKRCGMTKSSKCQRKLTSSPKEFQRMDIVPQCPSESTPLQQCVSSTAKKTRVKKPLFITKRVNAALKSNPNVLRGLREELSAALENKMQSLGIERGQERLSNTDFEAKKILIYSDMNRMGNNRDILVLRSKIDDLVTKKVKSYLLQQKGTRRIHFASPEVIEESPSVSTILEEPKNTEMKEVQPCSSSGFIVSSSKSPPVDMAQSVSLKNVQKDEEIFKNRNIGTKSSSANFLKTDFEIDALTEEFSSKVNLASSSSVSPELSSSSSLPVIMVKECPKENSHSAGNSKDTDQAVASTSFVRRELKFQKDSESKASCSLGQPEEASLNASRDAHNLDNVSSLESLDSWDDNYDVGH